MTHDQKQIVKNVVKKKKDWSKEESSACSGDIVFSLQSGALPEKGQTTSYDLLHVQDIMHG